MALYKYNQLHATQQPHVKDLFPEKAEITMQNSMIKKGICGRSFSLGNANADATITSNLF
ncbi:hypothetical protein GCM10028826_36760 [Mucilaginibacter boryungensis]